MPIAIRQAGDDFVGDMVAWGAHFCLFYETKQDLVDTLISYCKSGLEREEYCIWIVAEPLTINEARDALRGAVPNLERHLADSHLEIVSARDVFLQGGTFDGKRVTTSLSEKLAGLLARDCPGVRVTGDVTWLTRKDWTHFCDYEYGLNDVIGNQRLAVLCTYPLAACEAPQILDVVRTHQFVLARRHGNWDVLETAALKRAKAELNRVNEELEARVQERSRELLRASEALREAQAQLAHENRVTTMGQLAASISHELVQPIGSGITNAQAALRFLEFQPPDLDEIRQALVSLISDVNRASDIMNRIHALFNKTPLRKDPLNINEVILEVTSLTHGEAVKNGLSVQTQLAEGLPHIQADRVQLQQVILNLIINAIEAMRDVGAGSRRLLITSGKDESGGVVVFVQDSGLGLPTESRDRLFDAFYTTKPGGIGMGLSICRTIIEAHGGRLWATSNAGLGATFQFVLPTEATRASTGIAGSAA